eukprot:s462_g11.t1
MAMLQEHMALVGLQLDGSATNALSGLPVEAAIEFLDVVARKAATGHLKDPSNYVCATIARGYVPQAKLPSWQGHASLEAPPPANAVVLDMDVAASRLQSTVGMRKAEQAGIDLNHDALNALLRLPTQHASQLLEQVVEKKGTIRNLSNYVCATVARGFHPKDSVGTVWSGLPSPGPCAETEVPGAKAKGKGKATMESKGIELTPQHAHEPLKPARRGMEDEVANAKWNVYTLQRTLAGDFPLSPCITAVLFESCLHRLVPKAWKMSRVARVSEDFMFFGMIGLAWAVTLVTQPTFIYDNNITRMFKSYNVCIGLDSWPARPVAAAAFTLCVPVVCLTAALHAFKAHHDDGGLKLLRKGCLLVGAALGNAAMTVCIAVPPDDYIKCMIHTLGFAFTLFGQGIFKTGLIIEYWLLCKKHWDAGIWNRDALLKVLEVYFVTLVSHACVLVMAVGFLIYLLQLKDYHPIIARIQGDRIPTVSEGGVTVVGAWKGTFPFTWPVAHLVEPDARLRAGHAEPLAVFPWSGIPKLRMGQQFPSRPMELGAMVARNFLMSVTFLAPIIEVLTVPRKLLSPGVSIAYAPMRSLDV